jgi:membrane protein DedA with SNARE-associated domain
VRVLRAALGGGSPLAEFWREWGDLAYLAAAVWAFFEGETFVLVAAALGAATDMVDPWLLAGSVWTGSFLGDQLWFALGRRYGPAAVRRFPGAQRRLDLALSFIERYGVLFVLTFRFAYGVRNVASAACGMTDMARLRFACLNFVAAGLWAGSFVAGGWFLADWLGPDGVGWLLGSIGLLAIGWIVLRAWRGRSAIGSPAG